MPEQAPDGIPLGLGLMMITILVKVLSFRVVDNLIRGGGVFEVDVRVTHAIHGVTNSYPWSW